MAAIHQTERTGGRGEKACQVAGLDSWSGEMPRFHFLANILSEISQVSSKQPLSRIDRRKQQVTSEDRLQALRAGVLIRTRVEVLCKKSRRKLALVDRVCYARWARRITHYLK